MMKKKINRRRTGRWVEEEKKEIKKGKRNRRQEHVLMYEGIKNHQFFDHENKCLNIESQIFPFLKV